jgi:exosortase
MISVGKRFNRHGWGLRHALLALLLVALGVVLTFPAWADIATIVRKDPESSHVILVFPVIAWLVWVRRARLRHCQPRGTLIGPVLIAIGWAVAGFGFRNAVQAFFHGGAVLVVVGCLLTVLGSDILMRFLPAFIVLIFLVPVPGLIRLQVAVPLQTATAQVTQVIFQVLGQEIERSENQLWINGIPVGVAEACNGLRMVFTLALVSYAFAFGEPLRHYVRVLILLASPVSAIICNVVRLVPTLWVYGHHSQQIAHTFHDIAGWVMLVPAFLLLMGIIRLLRWAMIPVQHYTLASEGA